MIRVIQLTNTDGKPQATQLTGEEARRAVVTPAEPGVLRWVDVCQQTQADIDLLAQGYKFHPLALEDCLHFDQRPKLEEYSGQSPYLFVVTHNFAVVPSVGREAQLDEHSLHVPRVLRVVSRTQRCLVTVLETHAFLGQGYLVTVHAQVSPALEAAWQRALHEPTLFARGPDFVYYLLSDLLCDSNFPVLEQIGDILDDMEEAILADPTRADLHNIYSLRKTLVTMRRVLSPQRDVMGNLWRHGGTACVSDRTAPYYRDIYDHLTRIHESIEAGRDLLGNCVDAYMSAVGQRTNEIMKQLTILSAVLLPATFLSGLFGMNFTMMPNNSWVAFGVALMLMFVIVPGGMYLFFRRRGWLGNEVISHHPSEERGSPRDGVAPPAGRSSKR
jgi:magnesium transporter